MELSTYARQLLVFCQQSSGNCFSHSTANNGDNEQSKATQELVDNGLAKRLSANCEFVFTEKGKTFTPYSDS